MRRRSSLVCIFFLVVLVIVQTVLIFYHLAPSGKTRHQKKEIKSSCVNKTISRWRKSPVPERCLPNKTGRRLAYVFYLTNSKPEYECYLYVMLHQLQVVYPRICNVEFVVMHEKDYKFKPVIKHFKHIKFYTIKKRTIKYQIFDSYYYDCYLKLEVFTLHTFYDRVIFLDVDGVLFKNPNTLFNADLKPYGIGASFCNWFFPEKWLTSSIFVVDLTQELSDRVGRVLQSDLKSLIKHRKRILDMEIFNYLFEQGDKVKIMNDLFNMDSHYIDPEHIERFYNKSNVPYLVHFSHVKPHLARRYSSCLDETREKAKPEFFIAHKEFWTYYYIYC